MPDSHTMLSSEEARRMLSDSEEVCSQSQIDLALRRMATEIRAA